MSHHLATEAECYGRPITSTKHFPPPPKIQEVIENAGHANCLLWTYEIYVPDVPDVFDDFYVIYALISNRTNVSKWDNPFLSGFDRIKYKLPYLGRCN